mmetsp:Transcript_1786/g.2806  ORF Transcript_1786/g.2806 Transcript_1786/m.2806 type:complete len:224 (+) Transcript_1786:517-1188(+)
MIFVDDARKWLGDLSRGGLNNNDCRALWPTCSGTPAKETRLDDFSLSTSLGSSSLLDPSLSGSSLCESLVHETDSLTGLGVTGTAEDGAPGVAGGGMDKSSLSSSELSEPESDEESESESESESDDDSESLLELPLLLLLEESLSLLLPLLDPDDESLLLSLSSVVFSLFPGTTTVSFSSACSKIAECPSFTLSGTGISASSSDESLLSVPLSSLLLSLLLLS